MNNAQHAPAPWIHSRGKTDDWGCIRSANGRLVAKCAIPIDEDAIVHRRNGTDPTEENARLIAAAPELLEALARLLASASPTEKEHPRMFADWQQARAAITKATGKESS
jgi:hypothetical protein